MDEPGLPGSVLADLYVRIRDELTADERNLDPNHKKRAPIAMAILLAMDAVGTDIVAIEAKVRATLGKSFDLKPSL